MKHYLVRSEKFREGEIISIYRKRRGRQNARYVRTDVSSPEHNKKASPEKGSTYNRQKRIVSGFATPCRCKNITNMEQKKLSGLNHFQLCALLEYAAEIGAIRALIHVGKIRPYLNKSQAKRKYKDVEKWIDKGWVSVRKDGNHSAPLRIDRLELESIAKANDFIRRHLY